MMSRIAPALNHLPNRNRSLTLSLRLPEIVAALCLLIPGQARADDDRLVEHGVVDFVPTAAEASVPERFRQTANRFAWEATRMRTVTETLEVWDVTFQSPVTTPEAANNTVHAEYYSSRRAGQRPGVIVLHILGGDFPLARLFSNMLAQHGVNALFVKLPYYGPRRDPLSPRRMVSADPRETVEGMTQAILDIRRATAWLASRREIDALQLGVFGISLGGITGALAATAEPRLQNACLLLAGGDIAQTGWDAPGARVARDRWLAQGHSREEFVDILRAIDPVTHAAGARGKRILLLNATNDEVIPRASTESLWRALGEPEIRWLAGGHISVMRHLLTALLTVGRFFAVE
jgi:dienelactone hydrolase